MGGWVFPIAHLLLCLTSESLQGGLPRHPPNLGKGYSPSSGLGTAFGDAKPQKPGSPTQNGYGTGVSGVMEPPKPVFSNVNGLEAGACPDIASYPGEDMDRGWQLESLQGQELSQPLHLKMAMDQGLAMGTESEPVLSLELEPSQVRIPGPNWGSGDEGFGNGNSLGAQPGLGNGNGQGAEAIPGTGAQPGPAPQNDYRPDYGGVKPQKPGFGNWNGLVLGAQPGPPAQNGLGPGIGGDEGIGDLAMGTELDLQPSQVLEVAGNPRSQVIGMEMDQMPCQALLLKMATDKTMEQTRSPRSQDFRMDMGMESNWGTEMGWELEPSKAKDHSQFTAMDMEWQPSQLPYASEQYGPQNLAVSPAPTPATQWGPKPQKAGPPTIIIVELPRYPKARKTPLQSTSKSLAVSKFSDSVPCYQAFNGYGAEAEPGFHGLKLQKVGFHYGNGALEAGIFPEILQSGFPIASSFRNGQAEALRGSPWPALQPWGAGMKPGYGYAGLGNQAGPYGHLGPELGLEHFGGPEVKADTKSQLGNRYRGCGHRSLGPGVAAAAKLAARWPRSRSHSRSRSHPRRGRVHSRLSRARASLPPTPPPASSLPHPPLPGLPPGLSSGPPPPSALALAELPPLPALPLRPELLAPWGPGVHLALPELPPEVCAPAPPPAALALQDLPRLPAPAPPPAHLPLPPLPEAAIAAIPGPVGARGRPPLIAESPPQPLPPLPTRPSPFTLLAPPLPREPWPLPAFPPPLPPPPPPPYFYLSPPC
ncbi:hypothetical protein ACRRTK_006380 [Alexandromys fortis]